MYIGHWIKEYRRCIKQIISNGEFSPELRDEMYALWGAERDACADGDMVACARAEAWEVLRDLNQDIEDLMPKPFYAEDLEIKMPPIATYKATMKIEGCTICGAKMGEEHCAVQHACHDHPNEPVSIYCSCPKCSPR